VKDYYDILQVSPNAEQEVIEAAYKRLARKYHPDINRDPTAADRMRELNEAYEVLGDPRRRAQYDAAFAGARARPGARRPEEKGTPPPPGPPPPPRPTGRPKEPHAPAFEEPGAKGHRLRPVWLALASGLLLVLAVAGASAAVLLTRPSESQGDFSAFAGGWWHHGFYLTIDKDGQGTAEWRVYKWCSDDPNPPCDRIENNLIISGGSATLAFSRSDGQTADGQVIASNMTEVFSPDGAVALTLLPYDMALLRRQNNPDTTLCGPDFGRLAPESVRKTLPCGA
jgi:hypothetical protein